MNLTNIKYLYDLMDKEGFTYFTIYDSKGSPMRDQTNESYSVEDSKADLTQFLEYNSGVFRVEFRRKKVNTPNTRNFSFTIDNLKSDPEPTMQGIGNTGMGMDYMSVIRAKDEKIDKLQSEMFANMMAAMNRQHELQLEALTKEMEKADGGNDAMMQTAMSALGGMFGGGANIGVSGFDTAIPEIKENTHKKTENNMVDDTKRKINSAVVRLIQSDPEFANNISKLADLCEDNPMIYKMAISKLENL
tara:strand:+ start:2310 stop:3050 length:741 start_codon:yes stop_codon:yes gene_type:complete